MNNQKGQVRPILLKKVIIDFEFLVLNNLDFETKRLDEFFNKRKKEILEISSRGAY